jgi:hypothetical protein
MTPILTADRGFRGSKTFQKTKKQPAIAHVAAEEPANQYILRF